MWRQTQAERWGPGHPGIMEQLEVFPIVCDEDTPFLRAEEKKRVIGTRGKTDISDQEYVVTGGPHGKLNIARDVVICE